ncbi:hypothetical protein CBW65_17370 [Tumebacillus avium]|uniref:ABC transporter substrate-binding protein PnrA-like domain-containing protein n=2 Tax=Tumebacillus avium TaxID=1903704 RepID=A0A1Y0IT22_9BACL|nr:hypothetical protein CBW65_17370 [Tumebacillus avium]
MSVVSTAQSEAEQQSVAKLAQEVAGKQGLSADVLYPAQDGDVAKLASQKGLDLVLASADTPQIAELAKAHPELRFSLLGDTSDPELSNVRHLVHDRARVLFIAGYLAAEANRTSNQPFTVVVKELRAADDPDWQMIMAGMHYAGRKDVPVQVPVSALDGTDAAAGQTAAGQGARPLKGLSAVLLDPLSEKAWAGLGAGGQWLIRTDEKTAALPLQDRVIAQPASLYETALEQEAELLVSGKWTGQQKVIVEGTRSYRINNASAFADAGMDVRLELIEEQLKSGAIKPDQYTAGVGQ